MATTASSSRFWVDAEGMLYDFSVHNQSGLVVAHRFNPQWHALSDRKSTGLLQHMVTRI